jgi:outer membrane protein OmpA-like peptidoglycan-associated protein
VQESQITVVGLGESRPVADNGNADGRSKNRRVELHIDVPNPS